MEKFKLQHHSLVDQLKQTLLNKIAAGEWTPGMQVPSENELAHSFGLSPGTVRKAMDYLEDNKFILRQQGRGTFVLDPAGREIMRRFERFRAEDGGSLSMTLDVLSYEEGPPTEVEQTKLELSPDMAVRRQTRLRRAFGAPFLIEEIAIPADLFPASKDVDNPELWISNTARSCGVLLGDAEERISLAPCPEQAARLLEVPSGSTVMRIRGLMSTIDGRPARWRDAYGVTDGLYYSVLLTRQY